MLDFQKREKRMDVKHKGIHIAFVPYVCIYPRHISSPAVWCVLVDSLFYKFSNLTFVGFPIHLGDLLEINLLKVYLQ